MLHDESLQDRHAQSAAQFRGDMRVLLAVIQDDRTPLKVPLLMLGVIAYALLPIDMVPDVIPIGGLLDEAAVFMICRAFAFRMVPDEHIDEHAYKVSQRSSSPFGVKKSFVAASAIQISIMVLLLFLIGGAIFSFV